MREEEAGGGGGGEEREKRIRTRTISPTEKLFTWKPRELLQACRFVNKMVTVTCNKVCRC